MRESMSKPEHSTLISGAFHRPHDTKAFWRERGIDPDDDRQRELGRVTHAGFGSHDHGGHTVTLQFDFGGSGQGWPAYECSRLVRVGDERRDWYRAGTAAGLTYILRLCDMLLVDELHKAVGREVWCIRKDGLIVGMEQKKLDGGLCFIPKDFWARHSED